MATTAVFAEIIVVGLAAEAWIAVLVLAIFDTQWVDLAAVNQWAALVTVLVVAAAYVFGIIVDRIADSLAKRTAALIRKLRSKERPKPPVPFKQKRLVVLQRGGEGVTKFLEYQRSRQRVARGTVVNVLLAIPSVLAFLHWRTDASSWWLAGVLTVGVVALAASVYANERILNAYEDNLDLAYELVCD
jgi:4-hydroxybenzoate polyprenyltransferase